jgi:hypothetical protein
MLYRSVRLKRLRIARAISRHVRSLIVILQIEPDILPSSGSMLAMEVQMTNDQRETHRKKQILE